MTLRSTSLALIAAFTLTVALVAALAPRPAAALPPGALIARAPTAIVDLADTWDRLLQGTDEQDEAGIALASGDWNGDGIDDLAVGAWLADSFGDDRANAGEVYLFLGEKVAHKTGAERRVPDLFYGGRAGDRWGTAFASGDWDGDGTADLAIAARFAGGGEDTIPRRSGHVAILYGGAPAESARRIVDLAKEADLVVYGVDDGDHLGRALLLADLDDDGLDDLVMAAVDADGIRNTHRDCGEIFCVWGEKRATGGATPTEIDLLDFDGWSLVGVDPNDGVGRNLAAGDLDGDGRLDLVLAASFADGAENARTNAGDTYLIFGASREELTKKRELAREADCVLFGSDAYENSGVALAIGDLDADGLDDLAIGANLADETQTSRDMCGAVYLLRGRERGVWKRRIDLGRDADVTLNGAREGEQVGLNLVMLRWRGGSALDLAVSANLSAAGTPPRERAGKVFVVAGGPDLFAEPKARRILDEVAARVIDGAGAKDQAGFALGAVAWGADGAERLVIGAPFADGPRDERNDAGEAYVVPADISTSSVTPAP